LESVTAVTVDSLARRHGVPDVVFVDVEGFEQQVLTGAVATFEHAPDWFVEVHTRVGLEDQGGSVYGIVREFEERGYRLLVSDGTGVPFRPMCMPLPDERFFLVALAGPDRRCD
jgi:hypothetical protein